MTAVLAGTPTRNFCYDAAGNTTKRTTETGTVQDLTWDVEGHLQEVKQGSTTVAAYTYDTAGRRLIGTETVAGIPTATLYLADGTELAKVNGANPLSRRYYGISAVRDAAGGGLKWLIATSQGSNTFQIDPVTNVISPLRRFLPFGEPPTTQPAGWIGTHGYINGTSDGTTGLTYLGAREYDPTTGRFVSVDSLLDLTDPQQWNAYAYTANSPVTASDPSGMMYKVDGSGGGGLGHNYSNDNGVIYYETGYGVQVTIDNNNGRVCAWDVCGSIGDGLNDIHHPDQWLMDINRLAASGHYDPSTISGRLRMGSQSCVGGNSNGSNYCSGMFATHLSSAVDDAMIAEANQDNPTLWSNFVNSHPGLVEAAGSVAAAGIGFGLKALRNGGLGLAFEPPSITVDRHGNSRTGPTP